MDLPGRGGRGRTKRRFMNVPKGDAMLVGAGEEVAEDRVRGRWLICCRDSGEERLEEEKDHAGRGVSQNHSS